MANFQIPKETVLERLEELWVTGEMNDCTFVAGKEEKKIPVHKLFLAIASPVFYAMFFGKMAERSTEIAIPDVTSGGLEGMIEYLYTDTIIFQSVEHACEVLMAAKKYLLPFLEKKCLAYVVENTTPSNCVQVYEFGKSLYDAIANRCLKIFKCHTTEVVNDEAFLDGDRSTVRTIVELPEMELTSELLLFERVQLWAEREAERKGKELKDLAGELSDLVSKIRFRAMSSDEFASGPADSPLLDDKEKLAVYKCFVKKDFSHYPERLSKCDLFRADVARPNAEFRCSFDVCALFKMNEKEKIFSSQSHYVANVAWKFLVLKHGNYWIRICCEDKERKVKLPTVRRLRILNELNEELMNDFYSSTGWIETSFIEYSNGSLMLCFGGISLETLGQCKSIQVEAYISHR